MNSTRFRLNGSGNVVVLPGSDDKNRGDQALVWETREVGWAAGFNGRYSILAEPATGASQSRKAGFDVLTPLLRHPSTRYNPKSNLRIGPKIFIIWGAIAMFDLMRCLVLLSPIGRKLLWRLLDLDQRRTFAAIRDADICLVKGGGFIHSTRSISDPYRAFFLLFHVILAQTLRKPVLVMPNSFGPIEGTVYRAIVRYTLRRCALVTSRESKSKEALETIGVDSRVFPDLAFGLEAEHSSATSLESLRKQFSGRKLVGITARPYRFPYSDNPARAYSAYVRELAAFAGMLYAKGFLPVFVEHVSSEGLHENDRAAINAIADLLEGGTYAVISRPEFNCRGMKALYSEFDYVVGTRFHSVIFSLSEGVPSIAIAYGGNKGEGIMADADMGDYVIPIEEVDSNSLMKAFMRISDDSLFTSNIDQLRSRVISERVNLVSLVREAVSN